MHATWPRNIWQQKAKQKREPLVVFNAPPRPTPAKLAGRTGTKPKWHYDRLRRVREFEERDRRAA